MQVQENVKVGIKYYDASRNTTVIYTIFVTLGASRTNEISFATVVLVYLGCPTTGAIPRGPKHRKHGNFIGCSTHGRVAQKPKKALSRGTATGAKPVRSNNIPT